MSLKGRTIVISKAMRVVDFDTRREVKQKRLLSLEADNYNDEITLNVSDDEEYDKNKAESKEKEQNIVNKKKASVPASLSLFYYV
jgi:hypothetical protein